VNDAQTILFIRKLPRHISNLIDPCAFKMSEELIQRCNELWVAQTPEEAAAVAAAPSPQSPFRSTRRYWDFLNTFYVFFQKNFALLTTF
jgi:hypothetical protein